jgi:chromosome segregation protein
LHIAQLEIDNFKSFGKKTKIPFFEGFTVISGPNGSGKSNIVDSILFVLALSSSRGLRAEKLTDLINLNSGRNSAEVAITFSDGNCIRRRIKRTENGYYSYNYLNDRLCKQGDIVEFLAKFGIKPEGYNVVMQGDITRIMEMSDLDRRRIIDEIAGVAEFDSKRGQAISELEVVRERIEREELLLRELSIRLRELEKERERAVTFQKLQEDLAFHQACRGVAQLHEKEREYTTLQQMVAEQQGSLAETLARQKEKGEDLSRQRAEQKAIDEEISQKSGQEYLTLLGELESSRSSIKLAEQTIARSKQEKGTGLETLNRVYMDSKRAEARVAESTEKIRNLGIDRANLAMELATARARMEQSEKDLQQHSAEVEGSKDQLFRLMEQVEQLKAKRSDLLHEQDSLIEKSRMRTTEKERLNARLRQIGLEIEEKTKQLAESSTSMNACVAEKQKLDRELSGIESSLFAQRAALDRIRKETKAREQDLMRLEAQAQARGEGESHAIQAVLGMDGVYGTIGQLGKAPSEYATALSVAAGGKISNVVVDDDEVAAQAIRYLKENRLGRVTFLPLKKLRPASLPPLREEGVIDYAVNLLEYDPRYDLAFRLVFGATIVVDTLDRARRMLGRYRMVTLDGELLEKSGAMTGGFLKKSKGFGVAVQDEMARLQEALAASAKESADCEQVIARLAGEVEGWRQKRLALDEQIARHRILTEEYTKIVLGFGPEKQQLESTLHDMQDGMGGSSGQLAAIEETLGKISAEIAQRTAEADALKRRLDDTAVPGLVDTLEKVRKEIEEKERRLRGKESDIGDAQRERQYFAKRVEELASERQQLNDKAKAYDADIANAQSEIAAARARIAELEERQKAFSQELEGLRQRRDGVIAGILSLEQGIGELTTQAERFRLQVAALEERGKGLLAEVETLRAQAGDAETDLSLAEIEERIKQIDQAIRSMGAVNMLAVEEYDRISTRVAERSEKKEVLSKERTTLMERIEKYELMKYDAFITAFRAIDANFRETFARLTSGSGHLVLENEEDPFAGGLTFAVQPRDKKVHLLSALSGGEKSLTTLAFIFSIQKYLPAPFYALDEVDMFLDGSNVERIAEMIKEFSENAQSIIVSLRKPMIENANRILGVTLRADKSTLVTGVKTNG